MNATPITLLSGRFEVRAVLGQGASAVVVRATDSRLGVDRALKVLLPRRAAMADSRRRLEDEARTMARLAHPGIVAIHDVVEEGGQLYVVMEFAAGGTVAGWLERNGPMPLRMAVELMLALLGTLQAAHAAGVIHRDLKPQNILLTARGEAKIGDFGIAHLIDREPEKATRTGMVMGTWAYMAPEQRAGAKGIDARADVFSCGGILYELVTGELPPDLFMCATEPGLLDSVPPAIADVVRRATAYRPEGRFGSAAEMAEALRALLDNLAPIPAETPPLAGSHLGDTPDGATALLLGRDRRLTLVADEAVAGQGLTMLPVEDMAPAPTRPRSRVGTIAGVAAVVAGLIVVTALAATFMNVEPAAPRVVDAPGAAEPVVGTTAVSAVTPTPSARVEDVPVTDVLPAGEDGLTAVPGTLPPPPTEPKAEAPDPREAARAALAAPAEVVAPETLSPVEPEPTALAPEEAPREVLPEPEPVAEPVAAAPLAAALVPMAPVAEAPATRSRCPAPGRLRGLWEARAITVDFSGESALTAQVRLAVGRTWRAETLRGTCSDGRVVLRSDTGDVTLAFEGARDGVDGILTVSGRASAVALRRM